MANEKFKVKFGLAVGDTVATVDGTTGNIVTTGTLDVQGGTVTDSTGALSITTGAANGNITLDPNGTGNVVMTFANGGNLTNDRNYVYGNIRQTAAASAGDVWGLGTGTTTPYRGITLDNYLTATTTTGKRTGLVMRNYGSPPRASIITEVARGTNPSVPLAPLNGVPIIDFQAGGWTGASDGTGFQSTGSTISGTTLTIGTLTSGTIAVGQLISSWTVGVNVVTGTTITGNISGSGSGSTWTVSNSQTVASSTIYGGGDGWVSSLNGVVGAIRINTAENWTNQTSGTQFQVALSPTASTLGLAGANFTVQQMSMANTVFQSNAYSFGPSAGNVIPLSDGNLNFNILNNRITSGGNTALINFTSQRSATGAAPFSPTLNGDFIGQFKFNGNSYTGTPGTPRGPVASISAVATENWSGFSATGSSISGTTLTIGTVNSGGLIAVGQSIYGTGVSAGTKILANISGSGSGSTWTVNISQTVSSTTITGGVNGGAFNFNAIKTGTLDAYDVISGSTASLGFNSDTVNINSFDSATNRVSVNGTAASFNVPIRLNGSTSGSVTVAAPAVAGSQSYTLPTAQPTINNQVLVATTSGVMSWANASGIASAYGQWQNTVTITPAASNTAYALALPTIDFANIATVGSTSRIIPGAAGMFKLQFSAQVRNDDASAEHFAYFWWRKNGTNVPNSMGTVGVTRGTGAIDGLTIAGWDNMIQSANTTDYWELMYAVDDHTHVDLPAFGTTAFGPATASLFVTLVPVGA